MLLRCLVMLTLCAGLLDAKRKRPKPRQEVTSLIKKWFEFEVLEHRPDEDMYEDRDQLGVGHWKPKLSSFIVNGDNAETTGHPWMVSLQRLEPATLKWIHMCGGALIHKQKVLTSADCALASGLIGSVNDRRFRAALGWTFLDEENPHAQNIDISLAEMPDNVNDTSNRLGEGRRKDDVAILTLDHTAMLNDHVNLIPMARRYERDVDKDCEFYGWGSTEPGVQNIRSARLKIAHVFTFPQRACRHYWDNHGLYIINSHVCTSGFDSGTPCLYDVGGPLVCSGHLTGVLSWVDPDCSDCYPEVFTRVSAHRPWINNTLRDGGVRLDELP